MKISDVLDLKTKREKRVYWSTVVSAMLGILIYFVACHKRVPVPPVPVPPPAIVTPPANQTATAGQPASFSVTASGTGLAFQWQRNAQNLAGAVAPTYTIATVQLADSGASFRVIVSNSAGSVTSTAATLTVTPADARAPTSMVLTITPNPVASGQDIDLFAHLLFSATATPTGGICIRENGTPKNDCGLTPVSDEHWHTGGTIFAVGTHQLTATYPGDSNFQPSESPAVPLTVVAATALTVTSCTPNRGPVGTIVTIGGTGFTAQATVSFESGGVSKPAMPVAFLDSQHLQVSVPDFPVGTTVDITVTVPDPVAKNRRRTAIFRM